MNSTLPDQTAVPASPAATPAELIAALTNTDRLQEIGRVDFAHPALKAQLDAITARTAAELGLLISLVTLVLDSAQLVVGSSGLEGWISAAGGTPAEWSFCAHAVASGEAYVVPDSAQDPVQRDNPLVTVDGIASYAGVPLVSTSGQVLGAHCVIGATPHDFTVADLDALARAGDEVMALLAEYAC